MKLNKILVLAAAFIIHSTLFAATVSGGTKLPPELLTNLPPGEIVEPLPEAILQDPPVYLDVDSKGNVYMKMVELDKFGNYQIKDVLVSQSTLNDMASQREVVLRNMENISLPGQPVGSGSAQAGTSACPLPPAFSITATGTGQQASDMKVINTYRPVGATTQWLVYDFYTTNYRGRASHMPMVLFHAEIVHGWGAFIGDNHLHGSGIHCGTSSRFNSQIQGWTQYPPQPAEEGPLWTSVIFNGPNSCGNEMYDGPFIFQMTPMPRYRFEMQASTGHWVAYRVMELNDFPNLHWQVLTDWKVIDVDTGSWLPGAPVWSIPNDPQGIPQGIWFLATKAAAGAGSWSINIVGTQCGWF